MAFELGSRLDANLPLAEYLKTAAGLFSTLELHSDPGCLSPFLTYNHAQRKTIRIYQERFQFRLTMHAPFRECRLGALDEEIRAISLKKILNAMHLASELQIKLITFHPTSLEPDSPDRYREVAKREEEAIAALLKEAQKLAQVLLIENMPGDPRFHPSAADGVRLQELLWLFPETEFGLTIDIGYALQARVAIDAFLKMERVRHFHLHENDRLRDCHLPINTNLRWWSGLIKKLAANFPEATAILEMNSLDEQLISRNFLKNSLKKRFGGTDRLLQL